MTGCASPELGAHVLVKLMNRSGYELGSAVVSLTHLLHTSTEEVRATNFPSVSLFYYYFPHFLFLPIYGVPRSVYLHSSSIVLFNQY